MARPPPVRPTPRLVAAGLLAPRWPWSCVLRDRRRRRHRRTLHLTADKGGKLKFNKSRLTVRHGKVTHRHEEPQRLWPHGIAVEGHGVDKDGKTVQHGGDVRSSPSP